LGKGGRSSKIITADLQTLCSDPLLCAACYAVRQTAGKSVEFLASPDPPLTCPLGYMFQTSPPAVASTCTEAFHSCRVGRAGCPYGRSLLQVYLLSVRVQALSVGGAARLRVRSSVPPLVLETGGAGPAGGRPTLQRPQTRMFLPTLDLLLSLLPGIHE